MDHTPASELWFWNWNQGAFGPHSINTYQTSMHKWNTMAETSSITVWFYTSTPHPTTDIQSKHVCRIFPAAHFLPNGLVTKGIFIVFSSPCPCIIVACIESNSCRRTKNTTRGTEEAEGCRNSFTQKPEIIFFSNPSRWICPQEAFSMGHHLAAQGGLHHSLGRAQTSSCRVIEDEQQSALET